jgi:hypothetical protein
MTEDEAKTKACFQAATFGGSQQLAAVTGPFCIGSACMAWRGAGKVMFRDARTGKITDRDLTGHGQWIQTQGYCALAGQP